MDRIVEGSESGPQPEREMDKRCVTVRRKKGERCGRQSELYAPISRVDVDKSEMRGKGLTDRRVYAFYPAVSICTMPFRLWG